jgi:manganese/zinc/iron transport system substrate-binding protein
MKRLWMLCALLAGLGVLGCARDAEPQPATEAGVDGPYTIVATVGMVEDTVRAVAGDRAEVIGLMGAGVDPHLYKPTRTDVQRLMGADVVFYNGLLLEGKMADALVRAATNGKKVHAVTELLDEDTLLEPEEFEGLYDPHVWMDPASWAKTVDVVRAKLSEFDPAGADAYAANADAYTAEVLGVDAYAERVLMTVPESARVLVTAHDAFNYFGRRFGYEVVAIQGLSTESEAGVRDIEALVDLLVERGVRAVFVESTVSERNIRALVAGAAARGHDVVVGGSLFSDAMGDPGTYEGTYIGMIDHNVTTVARALGGEAPEAGMHGKLSP